MSNYLLLKFFKALLKEYIFIFLTSIILLFISSTNATSEENVFTVNEVKVEGAIVVNFSRDKYIDKAFYNSFKILMKQILLTSDLEKVEKIKLKKVKDLVKSFKILEESYREDIYRAEIKVVYNEKKVREFLRKENISFSLPKNISAVFFPVFYIKGDIQSLNENFFYKNWNKIKIENELINFVLPMEDLDDFAKINEMRNNLKESDILSLVSKYDIKNYIFALMDYENFKLNIYLNTSFNNNKTSKNISYEVKNLKDKERLIYILTDLKLKIVDLWKKQNLINLLLPLSIKIKFQHLKLENLDKLRQKLLDISMIDSYTLEEFNTDNSYFKIYYYGNPRKLEAELSRFGYELINNQGIWQLYLNE